MMRPGIVALLVAVTVVACTSPSEKERLEKRVAELEKQLGVESPSPEAPAGKAKGPAEPTPAREPAFALPDGAQLTLVLETSVSSAVSQVGEKVVARLEKAADRDGTIVVPAGTSVEGRVTEARPSGKVKGRARLSLAFDRIVVRGTAHPLSASGVTLEADPQHGKDAATIGAGAVLGGVIGAISGGHGAVGKGALVGTAAGTGVVLLTKGKEVQLPQGAHVAIRLHEALKL